MLKKLRKKFTKDNIQEKNVNEKICEMIRIEFILKIVIKCMEINDNFNYKVQKGVLKEERNELQRRIEEVNLENIEVFLNELRKNPKRFSIYMLSPYKRINSDEVKNEVGGINKFITNDEVNLLKKKILDIYEMLVDINENKNSIEIDEIRGILENIVEEGLVLVIKPNIECKVLKDYYERINIKIDEVIKDISCKI